MNNAFSIWQLGTCRLQLWAIAAAISLLGSGTVRAEQLPVVAHAASTEFTGGWKAINAVNGGGLTGNEHSAASAGGLHWDAEGTADNQWLRLDFGSAQSLGDLVIWNYNEAAYLGASTSNFDLYYRTTAETNNTHLNNTAFDPSGYTLFGNFDLAQAPGVDTYTGEPPIDLGGINAQFLAFDINGDYPGNGGAVGFSEIQVQEVIPEPSSLLLAVIGLLGLTFATFRRRRRNRA